MKVSVLDLVTTDPAFNLAAEEYVFSSLPRDRAYVMLWQNDRAVIIGKYQNTAAEVNGAAVEAKGIRVVRRLSGGGAVYHDLGNLNFTVITDAEPGGKVDLALFCRPVVRTLARFGVPAEISGRNDVTADGKKFSGNAQYIREGRVMHHGTILFDSDLSAVQEALAVKAEKLAGKGVSSVRSRVTNLKPLLPEGTTLAEFRRVLLEELAGGNEAERYEFNETDTAAIEALKEARYGRWEWNWGASPESTLRKAKRFEGCGTVEALIGLRRGRIRSLAFRGDFFSTREPEELAERLTGLPLRAEDIRKGLDGISVSDYFTGLDQDGLTELLLL
ncbi:MAG: lipoate--protein ligase [Lachnospiraceae bacterium]|nr:lipoate--protein ligase [Lachnospiraceae bacterium]